MVKTGTFEIEIQGRKIGDQHKPFVIAEMSGNHKGSLERALEIVEMARQAGVDALKLQTFVPDAMTLDMDDDSFVVQNKKSLWYGRSLHSLYTEAQTPWEWHKKIFERCKQLGLICFSTPFHAAAVDFLEELETPCYKIASFENTDLALIRKTANTKKPLLISTGMATFDELEDALNAAREEGCKDIVLMKCTSSYPADPADMHLRTIPYLKERFGVPVGLSDHSLGIGVAVASIACGASVIEKHFTVNRKDGGVDAAFSMDESDMKSLTDEVTRAWLALGTVQNGPTEAEKSSLIFRRSLFIVKDLKAGECLTNANMKALRPGLGISPKYFESLFGKRVAKNVGKGTPVTWDLIEDK